MVRLALSLMVAVFFATAAQADPLIYANNLVYQGAIKVPAGDFGTSTLSYGGQAIAFNPTNNSLFITGNSQTQHVAEISLPAPVISGALSNATPILATDLSALNTAAILQNFADITDGNMNRLAADGSAIAGTIQIGGMLKWGTGLIGTAFSFYDGANAAQRSHFKSTTTLSSTNDFAGMYQVGTAPSTPTASFVSGFMSNVPDNSGSGSTNWQTQLGGSALTGNGTLSILSRTSFGPAAFAFNPDRLGVDTPVADNPLLYYTQDHATLGPDGVSGEANPFFNATTKISGVVMVPGSRSILYFGYHGIGPYSYGDWTADPSAVVSGSVYYDPTGMGNKGPHAYPYIYQVWAYDANDLAAAKTGTYTVTQPDYDASRFVTGVYPSNTPLAVGQTVYPWNVKPYATWKLPFNFAYTQTFGGGAAFDPVTGNLYISEPGAVKSGCCDVLPLIHVFHLDLAASAPTTYHVSAKVYLLHGSLSLRNNGTDTVTVTSSDRTAVQDAVFSVPVAAGGAYSVAITSQPTGQTCTVYNGTGNVAANADISNVVVQCSGAGTAPPTTTRSLNGRLSGKIH